MKGGLDNMRRGLAAKGALAIVPAVVTLVGLAGIAAPPALNMSQARVELEEAEQRLLECEDLNGRLESFLAIDGFDRGRAGIQTLRHLLPRDITQVEIFSIARLAARAQGLQLETLSAGEEMDLGLQSEDDRIALRELSLTGRSDLDRLVGFVELLKVYGYPTGVLQFSIQRARSEDLDFEYAMGLGFFYRTDPVVEESGEFDGEGGEGEEDTEELPEGEG